MVLHVRWLAVSVVLLYYACTLVRAMARCRCGAAVHACRLVRAMARCRCGAAVHAHCTCDGSMRCAAAVRAYTLYMRWLDVVCCCCTCDGSMQCAAAVHAHCTCDGSPQRVVLTVAMRSAPLYR